MVEPVIIGDCTLYNGDCLDIMPSMERVNCIISDPPYELTYGGPHGSLGGKLSIENYDNKGGIVDCNVDWQDFMDQFYLILELGSHCYVMSNNRHVQNMLVSADNAGFRFHNLLAWDKGTATPNRWYMKNLEYTGFFYKGKAKFINDCGSKQLVRIPNVLNAKHPTEKPTELMQHYIENSTQPGQTVLDPFCGSGSTGVAAARSGRKFIGIELNKEYFDLSCQRIEAANNQLNLF